MSSEALSWLLLFLVPISPYRQLLISAGPWKVYWQAVIATQQPHLQQPSHSTQTPDGIKSCGSLGISGEDGLCHLSQSYPEQKWDQMGTGTDHAAVINVNHNII